MTDSHNFENSLLLVIPPVLDYVDGEIYYDRDFSYNLEGYLREFDTVTVACPASLIPGQYPGTRSVDQIPNAHRVRTIILPPTYREDRYVLKRGEVRDLLSDEIDRSRYILISPHAPFDWSTLAANLCIKKNRKYNMEADWNLPQVSYYNVGQMRPGLNKLRKLLQLKLYFPIYFRCLRNSAVSLLQGGDVYNAYKDIAPNPHSVLNVQITEEQRIEAEAIDAKQIRARTGAALRLIYAGRASDMKGPFQWLEVLKSLKGRGIEFQAIWFGDGERLADMRQFVRDHALEGQCSLPGSAPREKVFEELKRSDVFLFCHMTRESPRCVVEALAAGTPIVGFGSDYTRGLAERDGGGCFVEVGDVDSLVELLCEFNSDREKLAGLIESAGVTGSKFDRENAITERIELMRRYL